MEKNTETQLAQTQRSFKSDKILQNKSKIQTSLIGTKKKNSTKITPTINEKHHNPKNLDYELLENKEKNVDQNQNSLTIVKNNLDNTSHSTNQNPQTPENNYDRFKCSQNEQIDEKSLIISKTDKSLPIGPILKQKTNLNKKKENYKKASKQNISIVKKSNNRNFSACESQDFEKKPSNDFDSRPYEISPIHINNNNDIMDFKKYETKFEECTGDIEFSKRELEEYQKMITSKTFINLKNLIRPQENIRIICTAFIGLIGNNLDGFNEEFLLDRKIREWSHIQRFFENPGQLLNLISNYKEFIELGSVNEKNIQFTMDMLLEFSKNKNKENQEFNFEIIKILAEFINSACKYFRNYKIHELKISPIKPPKDLIQSNLTINRNSNDQTLEIENKMNTIYEKTKNADENELKGKELKKTNDRSISSTSKMDKEKMLIESKKDMKVYLAKKKVLTKKSKLDRIMNLKVTKPSAPSVIKDYLNKSSDIHRSFSCKKSKNDESLTFQDEIRRAQKEIREMEATKTKIMMLYEKQKKKDAEYEENQNFSNFIAKEKDNELKMKELLNQKKKEETKEIRSFRKQMRCESKNFKNSFESNLRTLDDNSSKEKDFSIKIDQDKKKNDKKREESLEKLQNILFIRENKKKNHEEEIKNNTEEYLKNRDALLMQKKNEFQKRKDHLENELFHTLQIFKKGK